MINKKLYAVNYLIKNFYWEGIADEQKKDAIKYVVQHFNLSERHARRAVDEYNEVAVSRFKISEKCDFYKGYYEVTVKGKTHFLEWAEVKKMFFAYSRKGLGLSNEICALVFNKETEEWSSIKSALSLSSSSNSLDPVTKYLFPTFTSSEDTSLDKFAKLVEPLYNKYKQLNKGINQQKRQAEKEEDSLLQHLVNYIEDNVRCLPKVIYPKQSYSKQDRHLIVTIADLHLGVYVKDVEGLLDYDSEIAKQRLKYIADYINKEDCEVTLMFLGDLVESVSGLNHQNTWHGIEQGFYLSQAIIKSTNILVEFCEQINNLHTVCGVPGNHGRFTAAKDQDPFGEAEYLIYYMMSQMMKGSGVNFKYDKLLVQHKVDGINYLIAHGDKKTFRKPDQIILKYFDHTADYNVLLQGHHHDFKILNETAKYRVISCPSIMSGNLFTHSAALDIQPGFMTLGTIDGKLETRHINL